MKIVSWNVNSIRARLPHVLRWLDSNPVDLLCLQETKVANDQFPLEEFKNRGLNVYMHGQPAYNGVAFITPHTLENVSKGFPEGDMNEQKRVISATLNGVRVVNVYIPQGESPDSVKFLMKEQFYKRLRTYMDDNYTPYDKIIICGDFNVSPADIDVHNVQTCAKKCGYLPLEVEWLENLMNWGFVDSFRHFNPETQQFSWWDYRMKSFENNKGMRIDHLLVSKGLLPQIKHTFIDTTPRGEERPSDHVPVGVELL